MPYSTIRFYAELNDHLPERMRGKDIAHPLDRPEPVGEILRQYGIPAGEVDLALRNGISVSLTDTISPGDRASFYPVFESIDIGPVNALRPAPLRTHRFILDAQLGKLASLLRMCGFDSVYRQDLSDAALIEHSLSEQRALLSRDRALLENPSLTRSYRVQSSNPREQLAEVLHRFDLAGSISPFSRCILCNIELVRVEKAAITDRLQPKVAAAYDEFYHCRSCNRIYWKGSHYEKMKEFIDQLIAPQE